MYLQIYPKPIKNHKTSGFPVGKEMQHWNRLICTAHQNSRVQFENRTRYALGIIELSFIIDITYG